MDKNPELRKPQPGETWAVYDGSPFPPKCFARVIEVKAGWVRYAIGETFNDERMEVDPFISVYGFFGTTPPKN